jgi:DNA-binding HxlR family transcriptional regulator
MISYSQFCPVAKASEVFSDRWTPIIMRELCFGPRAFCELLAAAPLISRTVLAQRLKQLAQAGVIYIEAKTKGKGHFYRLTPAGEDFRPIVELLSIWGQRWGQGRIGPDDLDPGMLVWECAGRSTQPRYLRTVLSSASIFAVYRSRVTVRVIGGWCSGPMILRFVSRPPRERWTSSLRLILKPLPKYGSAIWDLRTRLRTERSPCRALCGRSGQHVGCLHSLTNQRSKASDFLPSHTPRALWQRNNGYR